MTQNNQRFAMCTLESSDSNSSYNSSIIDTNDDIDQVASNSSNSARTRIVNACATSTSANIPIARPASISSPIDFTALDELQEGGTAIMEWERKGIRGGYTRRLMAQSRTCNRIRSRINVSRQPDPKRSKRNHRRNSQPRIASTGTTTTTAANSSGTIPVITHNDNNNNANLKLFRSSKGRYLEYVNSACTASNGVVGLYSASGNSPDDTCIFITDNRTMRRTRSAVEQQKDVLILLNFSQYLRVALEKELNMAKFLRRSTADTEEGVAIDADVLRCYPLLRHGLESAAVARYLLNGSTTGAAILSLFRDAVAMLVHHVNTILLKFAEESRVGFRLILLLDIVLTPTGEGVWPWNENVVRNGAEGQIQFVDLLLDSYLSTVPNSIIKYDDIEIHSGKLDREAASTAIYSYLRTYNVVVHDFVKVHNLIIPSLKSRVILLEETKLIVGFSSRFSTDPVTMNVHCISALVSEYVNVLPVWKNSFKVRDLSRSLSVSTGRCTLTFKIMSLTGKLFFFAIS